LNTSYRLYELQGKEIINISDGRNIGRICDVEIEGITGGIIHIVVPGKPKYFGLFGRGEDVFIPWGKIKLIGIDSILIDYPELYSKADRLSKSSIWSKIFD
jgi:YlmC/YmxH family sporulation protein